MALDGIAIGLLCDRLICWNFESMANLTFIFLAYKGIWNNHDTMFPVEFHQLLNHGHKRLFISFEPELHVDGDKCKAQTNLQFS